MTSPPHPQFFVRWSSSPAGEVATVVMIPEDIPADNELWYAECRDAHATHPQPCACERCACWADALQTLAAHKQRSRYDAMLDLYTHIEVPR